MITIKELIKKIDDISRTVNKDERRALTNVKKQIISLNDKVGYEANFDKRFSTANYNKLLEDLKEIDKSNVCLIFIHIPNLELSFHIGDEKKELNETFLTSLKALSQELILTRKNIYTICNYLILIADKKQANSAYLKIKSLKNSKKYWQDYQMTYIRYKKYSAKVNKNVCACIKQANNIFSGKKEEVE